MNKAQLIEMMADKANLTKASASKALDAFLEVVTSALTKGDMVSLIGFGTFEAKVRQARAGRNPKTGEVIQIPEALVPVFKAGKGLKEAVSNGEVLEEAQLQEA